ncbi:Hpt domain-containing protein, partial [Rhodobacter viridis]
EHLLKEQDRAAAAQIACAKPLDWDDPVTEVLSLSPLPGERCPSCCPMLTPFFLDRVRATYLSYLAAQKQHFDGLALTAWQSGVPTEVRQDLRDRAHKLAGNGDTHGFHAVSQTARALEDALEWLPGVDDAEVSDLLRELIAACQAACAPQTTFPPGTAPEPVPGPPSEAPAMRVSPRRQHVLIVSCRRALVRRSRVAMVTGCPRPSGCMGKAKAGPL